MELPWRESYAVDRLLEDPVSGSVGFVSLQDDFGNFVHLEERDDARYLHVRLQLNSDIRNVWYVPLRRSC